MGLSALLDGRVVVQVETEWPNFMIELPESDLQMSWRYLTRADRSATLFTTTYYTTYTLQPDDL